MCIRDRNKNMYGDKISVIIPIYNMQEYLDKCISSVMRQTYDNLEIILVDDGSCDQSLAICRKYQKSDKRIQAVSYTHLDVYKRQVLPESFD